MFYEILENISNTIYSVIAGILKIEESLISFMISCVLAALKLICHPIMIIPLFCVAIYGLVLLVPKSNPAFIQNRMLVGTRSYRTPRANVSCLGRIEEVDINDGDDEEKNE